MPLVYRSSDFGEHWSGPFSHNIPFGDSKIYAGTLSDGRNYLIGNLYQQENERTHLAVFFSDPGTMRFTRGGLLQSGYNAELDLYPQWSYPSAVEWRNKLYVLYTMQTAGRNRRGALLSVIPL